MKIYLSDEAKAKGLCFKAPRDADGGFDLPALEDIIIPCGEMRAIRTGVHMGIPHGWVGLVRDRSSVAIRGGATVAGVIDSSYRGEVKVVMYNWGKEPLEFRTGDRIAQCVVIQHYLGSHATEALSLDDLGETERGAGGFGSTGR